MNLEKINDVIDVFSNVLNLPQEHRGILKELIPKLIDKYSKQYPSIPVSMDNYDKYVIKPENGQYSLENFFLNRLMRNIWSFDFNNPNAKGGYEPAYMALSFNEQKISGQLMKALDPKRKDFAELDAIARKKVVMHEFEHGLQTRFEIADLDTRFSAKYREIIERLSTYKNEKYAKLINTYGELRKRGDGKEWERYINSGLHYSGNANVRETYRTVEGFDNLNEIFNETESLDMANAKIQGMKVYPNGSYYNVRNAESSNRSITNYGTLLKVLIPDKAVFYGMYIEPEKMFDFFNKEYDDIFKEEFNNDKSAWENLIVQITKIKNTDSELEHLKLDKVLARCLEKKVDKKLGKVDVNIMKGSIQDFYSNVMCNDDRNIENEMEHIKVLQSIDEKIRNYEKSINGTNEILQQNREEQDIEGFSGWAKEGADSFPSKTLHQDSIDIDEEDAGGLDWGLFDEEKPKSQKDKEWDEQLAKWKEEAAQYRARKGDKPPKPIEREDAMEYIVTQKEPEKSTYETAHKNDGTEDQQRKNKEQPRRKQDFRDTMNGWKAETQLYQLNEAVKANVISMSEFEETIRKRENLNMLDLLRKQQLGIALSEEEQEYATRYEQTMQKLKAHKKSNEQKHDYGQHR